MIKMSMNLAMLKLEKLWKHRGKCHRIVEARFLVREALQFHDLIIVANISHPPGSNLEVGMFRGFFIFILLRFTLHS